MAEDHGASITLRQPADLLVHGRGFLVHRAGEDRDPRRPVRRASSRPRFLARRGDGPGSGPCARSGRRRRAARGPSRSGRRIDPARRASTRKTAWKASSAACSSPSRWRQTPSTIGPCRATRTAKAASRTASGATAKRSTSSTVRHAGHRPRLEEGLHRARDGPGVTLRHVRIPPAIVISGHPFLTTPAAAGARRPNRASRRCRSGRRRRGRPGRWRRRSAGR